MSLQTVKELLENPTQTVNDMSYFNCLDSVMENSKVLSAATIVAKHTLALCNTCRLASFHTANPVAKHQFVQSAEEVANSKANLVKTIKAPDGTFNKENRERCHATAAPLIEAVDNLMAFASNPEFATVPAQISPEGCRAMKPIVSSAKTMLESSTGLIQTARCLAVNPKDLPQLLVFASHSCTISDSIKKLITNMRDKTPGERECDEAIEVLNRSMQEVDQASLAAISQQLAPQEDMSQEMGWGHAVASSTGCAWSPSHGRQSFMNFSNALHNQMITAVQEISNLIEPMASTAQA
ncbi:talin-1 [Grus japonensis]|uniref:Talin-1 n=1 Tax=Grus japonensis TaxID=30415 RepID=A0ABC9YE09_GRUJA